MTDKKEWQFIDPIYYEGEAGYLATDSKNTKAFVDEHEKVFKENQKLKDALEKITEALREHHGEWNNSGYCMAECSRLCKVLHTLK